MNQIWLNAIVKWLAGIGGSISLLVSECEAGISKAAETKAPCFIITCGQGMRLIGEVCSPN